MKQKWYLTVGNLNGFTAQEIDELEHSIGSAPSSQEDPIFIDGERRPRALEWDFHNIEINEDTVEANCARLKSVFGYEYSMDKLEQ